METMDVVRSVGYCRFGWLGHLYTGRFDSCLTALRTRLLSRQTGYWKRSLLGPTPPLVGRTPSPMRQGV
jgi:hypothetical protein